MMVMSADDADSGHIVHLVADRVAKIVVAVTITVEVSIVVCC